jgi:hypothetical protein
MDLFPSSDEGREKFFLLGPLEGANLNHWTLRIIEFVDFVHRPEF